MRCNMFSKYQYPNMRWIFIILFVLGMFSLMIAQDTQRVLERFSESSQTQGGIQGWKEKEFVGSTQYSIQVEDDNYILHAVSDSTASGLYKEIKYDTKEYPFLSWRWKVIHLPEQGDVHSKETDDYGARVYVVFPRFLKWKTKTINYIWAKQLPKGDTVPNTWLPKNAIMIAAQSGSDSLGVWITEKRNVYEDYRRLFGDDPPKVGAIAVMSDADNTGGHAEAFYDDFVISKQ